MKTSSQLVSALALTILLCEFNLVAAVYNGNGVVSSDGNVAFNGVVGNGSLSLSDNGTTISGTFTKGGGSDTQFTESLVFFIDSISGGIADTTSITANSNAREKSISGRSGSGYYKSSVIFASGFRADYALVLNPTYPISVLYQIGADSTLFNQKTVSLSPLSASSTTYDFSINWSDISGGGPNASSFKFQSTYISIDGYRSLESFETLTGSVGYNTTQYGFYNTYSGANPVPEPVNVALGVFGAIAAGAGALRWTVQRYARG